MPSHSTEYYATIRNKAILYVLTGHDIQKLDAKCKVRTSVPSELSFEQREVIRIYILLCELESRGEKKGF